MKNKKETVNSKSLFTSCCFVCSVLFSVFDLIWAVLSWCPKTWPYLNFLQSFFFEHLFNWYKHPVICRPGTVPQSHAVLLPWRALLSHLLWRQQDQVVREPRGVVRILARDHTSLYMSINTWHTNIFILFFAFYIIRKYNVDFNMLVFYQY